MPCTTKNNGKQAYLYEKRYGEKPDTFKKWFSVNRRSQTRTYLVTWPGGATWEYDRYSLEMPEFDTDGHQTGVELCFDSNMEARRYLTEMGCYVEKV